VHGNRNLSTPRIDSLAREGAIFDRFYACPLCAPTRAELLTGRYHPRGGVHGVTTGAERLNLDERTVADVFRAAGYATAAFGKWHNGTQYPYHPNGRGFAEYYGFCSGHWGHYFDPLLEHNGQLLHGKGFIIDDLTDHALAFIEQHRDGPFFCYLPYNTPHTPWQVPDRFFNKFRDQPISMRYAGPQKELLDQTRCALAMCENIDWNVGRVLDRLAALGVAENTIVIYLSDNGPNSWRWNGEMRGRKGSTDEGGVRVPCLVRWPGHVRPGTKIAPIAGMIDLLPTLADLAGITLEPKKPLDGVSLKPLLVGSSSPWPERVIFSYNMGQTSARTQQYRLDSAGRLYDMQADPGQRRDIAAQRPEVATRLRAAVAAWKAEVLPGIEKDDRPFTVGYPQFPTTFLPARDGVAAGGIERSTKAPNCSYFTHWTSAAGTITWDIQVATTGTYEARVYYTCPPTDVGSTVELACGASRVRAKIAVAHDPPAVGAEQDRSPRTGESLVKEFRPLELGTMRLEQGRGTLVLRALDMPGAQVMEVRAVELRLR
jgi:arylsulfatase A-like enzyme